MAEARLPARSEPVNSQFFLPMAMGRIVFSTGLLSIDWLNYYNHRRLHSTLNYISPMMFEQNWLVAQFKKVRLEDVDLVDSSQTPPLSHNAIRQGCRMSRFLID
jgi:hypothetical protein